MFAFIAHNNFSLTSQTLYSTSGGEKVWENCHSLLVLPNQHIYWR